MKAENFIEIDWGSRWWTLIAAPLQFATYFGRHIFEVAEIFENRKHSLEFNLICSTNNWNYRVCSWTSLQLGSMVSKQSRTSYTEENDALPFNDFLKKTPNKNKNKNKKYLYDKYRFNKIMFLSSKLQSLNRYCSVKCL